MGRIQIKKGLILPITGEPKMEISAGKTVSRVAIVGPDYVGMKPTMMVKVGDEVKLGQLLFTDKKMPRVRYTSPGAGKVVAVNRGHKRVLLSVVVELQGDEEVKFKSFAEGDLASLGADEVRENLLESGLWTTLRRRPFSMVANPDETPHSIFITAMDSNPLAPDISTLIAGKEAAFKTGLSLLSKLTEGKLFLCKSPETTVPGAELERVSVEEFSGPHPSGNVGTHIHFLDPVGRGKVVWYINAQDVIAIAKLFTSGKLDVERVVALAGPSVNTPRLVKTRQGASLFDLTKGEIADGDQRIISGSVFSGHTATEETGFLGRFHQQVTVLPEGRQKDFLGWLTPGLNKFSIKNLVLSRLFPGKKFDFNTAVNGGQRAIVPIGNYEKVMPLDILPTFLLRALAVDDLDNAEKLGALELDEEDLALCTFVCPSKLEYGPMLRRNLDTIHKEG